MSRCSSCGRSPAVLRCGKCRETVYCQRDCQRAHWKAGHRAWCSLPSPEERAAARRLCAEQVGRLLKDAGDAGGDSGIQLNAQTLGALERAIEVVTSNGDEDQALDLWAGGHTLAAAVFRQQQNWPGALRHLRPAANVAHLTDGDAGEAYASLGLVCCDADLFDEGEEQLRRALAELDDSRLLWKMAAVRLGVVYQQTERYGEAVPLLSSALEKLEPETNLWTSCQVALGASYARAGDAEAGVRHLDLALTRQTRSDPAWVVTMMYLGEALMADRQAERAVEALEAVLEVGGHPGMVVDARMKLSRTLLWDIEDGTDEAILQLQAAREEMGGPAPHWPAWAPCHTDLGVALSRKAESLRESDKEEHDRLTEEALGHLRTALHSHTDDRYLASTHAEIGVGHRAMGRNTEAIASYEAAFREQPEPAGGDTLGWQGWKLAYARLLLEEGRVQDAMVAGEEARAALPRPEDVAGHQQERYAVLLAALESLSSSAPSPPPSART